MQERNVLRVNAVEEETAYLLAVHRIIAGILAEKAGRTLIDIAETIDVDKKTISNAFNKTHRLSPMFLTRLGCHYGAHVLNPYLELMGARAVPLDGGTVLDILPRLMRAGTRIAEARHPESVGGTVEVHTEKLQYLPELETLARDLDALIVSIRKIAA
jgi:hypothetical protein